MKTDLRPTPSSARCEAPGQELALSAGTSVFHKGKLNIKISPKAGKGRKGRRRGADPGVLTQGCLLDRWEQRSLSSCQSSKKGGSEGQKDR